MDVGDLIVDYFFISLDMHVDHCMPTVLNISFGIIIILLFVSNVGRCQDVLIDCLTLFSLVHR